MDYYFVMFHTLLPRNGEITGTLPTEMRGTKSENAPQSVVPQLFGPAHIVAPIRWRIIKHWYPPYWDEGDKVRERATQCCTTVVRTSTHCRTDTMVGHWTRIPTLLRWGGLIRWTIPEHNRTYVAKFPMNIKSYSQRKTRTVLYQFCLDKHTLSHR